MAYDEYTAERIRRLLTGCSHVVERKMMGGLCFVIDGAMCCAVSGRGGLLVRVGANALKEVLSEAHTAPMNIGKRTMTGFVLVTPAGYRSDADLRKWVGRGLNFVSTVARKRRV